MKKYYLIFTILCFLFSGTANAASVIANVNGNPITDTDVTARVKLMTLQGYKSTNNRQKALDNIIDDYVKLAYADQFKFVPNDKEIDKQIKQMESSGFNSSGLDSTGTAMMRFAIRANIAWQMVIVRTIIPTINVEQSDIDTELVDLERDRGLPLNTTMIRLIDIPKSVAEKLTKPTDCDNAMKIARDFGGQPQKITALEYELDESIRKRIAGLPIMEWSDIQDNSVLLICSKTKTKEYGKLDEIIKQNASYKKAIFTGDQQLKQLRRKAVIVINDERYK